MSQPIINGLAGTNLGAPGAPVLDFSKASGDPNAGGGVDDSSKTDEGKVDDGKPVTFESQAALDKVIQERVGREKNKTNELAQKNATLEARVKELEPLEVATQTDTQRWEKEKKALLEENAELKNFKASAQRADLVREIAKDKGLPDGFLNRVSGETPEEIEADVVSLLEALGGTIKATKPAPTTKPTESKTKPAKASHGGGGSDGDDLPPISDVAAAMRKQSGQPYFSQN